MYLYNIGTTCNLSKGDMKNKYLDCCGCYQLTAAPADTPVHFGIVMKVMKIFIINLFNVLALYTLISCTNNQIKENITKNWYLQHYYL